MFAGNTGGRTMIHFELSTIRKWQEWMRPLQDLKGARSWRIGNHVELCFCRRSPANTKSSISRNVKMYACYLWGLLLCSAFNYTFWLNILFSHLSIARWFYFLKKSFYTGFEVEGVEWVALPSRFSHVPMEPGVIVLCLGRTLLME